ncbi:GNAT family N-acetyltransferase [Ensifer sp. MJa1]|uniref:GNAT family N-acetyltransferase n=1 Tax=Ensifer sp. MJa1 TaxID=2919888 RepID=UPI003009EA9E
MEITLQFTPVTEDRWADFERLFEPNGAYGGCWCTALRLPHSARKAMSAAGNKAFIRTRIGLGPPPGILGYFEGAPVAWVQVGPRHDIPQFNSPRTVARPLEEREATDPKIWALSCLFMQSKLRGRGLSHQLVSGAVAFARASGARYLDACPIDHAKQPKSVALWVGPTSVFEAAGFEVLARRKDSRPLMRLDLGQ